MNRRPRRTGSRAAGFRRSRHRSVFRILWSMGAEPEVPRLPAVPRSWPAFSASAYAPLSSRTDPRTLILRDRQSDVLARRVAPSHDNDDVLFSVGHVRHRRARGAARQRDLPDYLACGFVVGTEHSSATPRRNGAPAGVGTFTEEHQAPGDER